MLPCGAVGGYTEDERAPYLFHPLSSCCSVWKLDWWGRSRRLLLPLIAAVLNLCVAVVFSVHVRVLILKRAFLIIDVVREGLIGLFSVCRHDDWTIQPAEHPQDPASQPDEGSNCSPWCVVDIVRACRAAAPPLRGCTVRPANACCSALVPRTAVRLVGNTSSAVTSAAEIRMASHMEPQQTSKRTTLFVPATIRSSISRLKQVFDLFLGAIRLVWLGGLHESHVTYSS